MEINFSKYDQEEQIELPPGFRFHPTDNELIIHYLYPKVVDASFVSQAVGDVDLNKFEPWDLPLKAKFGEKEWYFFCVRDRKYPTGLRTNRATEMGYWKATGKDKEIYKAKALVGMKKTLVFYKGRAPKGEKTNWIMHEFRLEGKLAIKNISQSTKGEWVISKVFEKNCGGKKIQIYGLSSTNYDGCVDDLDSSKLPQLMDVSRSESETIPNAVQEQIPKNEDLNEAFDKSIEFMPTINDNPMWFPNTQMVQNMDYLQYQDPSILSFLIDNDNRSNILQNPTQDYSTDINGPVELDCLWSFCNTPPYRSIKPSYLPYISGSVYSYSVSINLLIPKAAYLGCKNFKRVLGQPKA